MSASESAFSDAEDDTIFRAEPGERKRLRSVEEIVKNMEGKRQRIVSPKQKGEVSKGQRQDLLTEIRGSIDDSIKRAIESLWERIDQKISSLENKIDKLENQVFERDQVIDELQEKISRSQERIERLEDQVEDMEIHSRSSQLVFWSQQLGKRSEGENIEEVTVKFINENFPTKAVTKQDFSAIHRLSNENSVICSFTNKNLRNEIYAERLNLRRREVTDKGKVFVNESLTRSKREIFSRLLELKRSNRIWTTFTRNGIPCLKMLKDSNTTRIFSMQQLDLALRRAPPPPPSVPLRGEGGRPLPAGWDSRRGGGAPAAGPRAAPDAALSTDRTLSASSGASSIRRPQGEPAREVSAPSTSSSGAPLSADTQAGTTSAPSAGKAEI